MLRPSVARRCASSSVAGVTEVPGRGRAVLATAPIESGTVLHVTAPMAQVLKHSSDDAMHCAQCLDVATKPLCSHYCKLAYEARGGSMLERVNLSPLHHLHEVDGRKFPLLIAYLLADLLAEVKATRAVPIAWPPLELCYSELHEEAHAQVESEHAQMLSAFAAAGLANAATLELFLPLGRYQRLLGAAQLNAFELTLSHGARVSALLPGLASCFNHSCEPNVLISCGATNEVAFVAGAPIPLGTELCISYLDVDQPREARRELLLHKYGFECDCARCQRGE